MPDKPTQQLLPFSAVTPVAISPPLPEQVPVQYEPSAEALAAFERLEDWLLDPRTEKPRTDLAEEALRSVGKALLEGKNAWFQAAEDHLETLALRNGKTAGEDIPPGPTPVGDDFQRTLEGLLDHLHERFLSRSDSRSPACP